MHVLITPMKDANDDYMLATDSVIPCLQTLCRFKDGIKFVAGKIMRLALLLESTISVLKCKSFWECFTVSRFIECSMNLDIQFV